MTTDTPPPLSTGVPNNGAMSAGTSPNDAHPRVRKAGTVGVGFSLPGEIMGASPPSAMHSSAHLHSPSHATGAGLTNGRMANGHEALDLAETAEVSSKQAADRLEAKRVEHERTRNAQRAKFEEQMRLLEAEQLAEEHKILSANGEAASAPTTPPGGALSPSPAGADVVGAIGAIGAIGAGRANAVDGAGANGNTGNGNGAKSMPASRRTSSYGTFGFEKLSLSVMDDRMNSKNWAEDDEADNALGEGAAQSSVKYLGMGDDDFGLSKPGKRISVASAALDLAPLSQTPPRAYGSRPFDTALKTSEWPNFQSAHHPHSAHPTSSGARGLTSPMPASQSQPVMETEPLLAGRKASPSGLADSVASLPAMPSKSVPATPYGVATVRRSGTEANIADGFSASNRGFSNPDLARNFGQPKFAPDANSNRMNAGYTDGYGMFSPPGAGALPPSAAVAAAFTPQPGGYDNYAFDDEGGFGSGALYSTGTMGLKNKRAETDRDFNRFAGVRIEDIAGDLLALCKDQHGCRYLQKKLEEGDPAHRDLIFRETYGHFPELMTDPFGNYLCQKLLEYSTEEQRTLIIESVANDLVGISLNMHGTRAVQKMVDFLASPRQPKQIRTLIYALSVNVVALIKDLNGNHVIQKCRNKLVPEDNQFIYNAIAANLIEVATHRHGCCVLQRSIDHASPAQRVQLVTEIIFNSLYLVQDPFGNYVIQYILDLNDARFSEPLIRTFIGNVCSLSVQKFSSNVVEKCIRVADAEVRKALVNEVLNRSRLEKLLRDSYGNYVIQTILDYCDMNQRIMLIDFIRPILPSIRNTPYGKRIQSKLAREDSSFATGPFAPRGGFRGGHGGDRGGFGPVHRHLGRPQLQHINALTEVYGSHGGPFVAGGPYGAAPGPAQGGYRGLPNGAPPPGQGHTGGLGQDHTGLSYHAPGPDGAPWLHLRGGPGGAPGAPGAGAGGWANGLPDMQDGGDHQQQQQNMWQATPGAVGAEYYGAGQLQHHAQHPQGVPMM